MNAIPKLDVPPMGTRMSTGAGSTPPRAGKKDTTRDADSARSAETDGNGPINILIVDDEPRNLTVLETILDDPAYRLVRAETADEALLALMAEPFALLILDIRLPGMTGFELAELIKQRKRTAHVPIIFLTAYYSEDQHVLEGYDAGAVDYLHKPVNPRILRSKVAVFAELYRKSLDAANANRALTNEVAVRRRAEEQLREMNETLEQRVAARTDELRNANRLKDEFLAMLSHELRNPLSAIMNAVQMIDPSGHAADRTSWALSLVERQTRSLRRIVDDLLDVARVVRGKIELRKEPVDLLQAVRQAVDSVRPLLNSDEELELVLPIGPLQVDADFTRLEQSIVNLLLNAVKFAAEHRRIRVTVERANLDAIITIADNGIGIAPAMLARIFELFTQADRSLDRVQGGLGIGLYICKQLIEMHGGSISAHSDGVGQGAVFTLRLPLLCRLQDVVPRPSVAPAEPAAEPETTKRVLVVDDNIDAAVALSWLIGQRGHAVRVAHDGPEALRTAADFKPDVLLLDLGLPGIDGYEIARRLRADGFAGARMIAISGYARDTDVEASRLAGFDRHFAKPVEFADLVAALE